MASRKRIYTSKTLKVIDTASANADKLLGILHILEPQLNVYLEDLADEKQDVESVLWVVKDLVSEIGRSCDELNQEEMVYADTLDEFLDKEKAEMAQALSS